MPTRPPDREYAAYTLDFRELESRVRFGELENYDWSINYDAGSRIYYTVRIWLKQLVLSDTTTGLPTKSIALLN